MAGADHRVASGYGELLRGLIGDALKLRVRAAALHGESRLLRAESARQRFLSAGLRAVSSSRREALRSIREALSGAPDEQRAKFARRTLGG